MGLAYNRAGVPIMLMRHLMACGIVTIGLTSAVTPATASAQTPTAANITQRPALPASEQRQFDATFADRKLDAAASITIAKQGASVRDILDAIGVTVQTDDAVAELDKTSSVRLTNATLADTLGTLLTSNGIAFKPQSARAVFVYADTPANHEKYEESIVTYQVKTADGLAVLTKVMAQLRANKITALNPVLYHHNASNTLTVRATASSQAEIARLIALYDK